jgi:gluconate kinase
MLIWINGAFGSGKTLVAHELQRRLGAGHVSDPELIGIAMHKMLPGQTGHDFQDLPQWRSAVLLTLAQAELACEGPLIVPMTIVHDDYFDEIIGGLRTSGIHVRHYALTATRETLQARLRLRGGGRVLRQLLGRDETWAIQQIDRCVTALSGERYATHVPTDEQTPDEIVEAIAADAGLELGQPRAERRATPNLHRLACEPMRCTPSALSRAGGIADEMPVRR